MVEKTEIRAVIKYFLIKSLTPAEVKNENCIFYIFRLGEKVGLNVVVQAAKTDQGQINLKRSLQLKWPRSSAE